MTEHTSPTKSNTKRIIFLIILGVFLLTAVWLGVKTWRIYQAGQSLLDKKAEVEALAAGGLSDIDPDEAEALILEARRDIYTLDRETAVFMPLTPYLGWVPKLGPTLVAARPLMAMAVNGADAGAFAFRGLKPALALMQTDNAAETNRLSQLTALLPEAAPDLQAARDSLILVQEARSQITDTEGLPRQLETLLALGDEWLPLAIDGLRVTAVAPDLLGQNGPKNYLLIAQNEDELRSTGGFISSAGILTVENGKITNMNMMNSAEVDDYRTLPYDFPPQPYYDYMGLDMFLFLDANFWPDFPTSAEKAMDLYSYGQHLPPLDGVIAIDQEFTRLLLEATGPIPIDDNTTINAGNIIDAFRDAWGAREEGQSGGEWIANRKAFIGLFAAAIKTRLETNPADVDLITLGRNMSKALAARHLQIYTRDPETQAVLDEINWDGRLENEAGQDFLALIDANMGFNKANVLIERAADYHVTLDEDGRGEAALTLTYTHTGPQNGEPCTPFRFDTESYASVPNYMALVNDCYWNYLRLYVPEGSVLLSASEHPIPGEMMRRGQPVLPQTNQFSEQPGFTTFATFLLVPRGETVSSQFQYRLPAVVHTNADGSRSYQLYLRKQAGVPPEPVRVSVTLPAGSRLLNADPAPADINGDELLFDLSLDADKMILIAFQ